MVQKARKKQRQAKLENKQKRKAERRKGKEKQQDTHSGEAILSSLGIETEHADKVFVACTRIF